MYPEWRYPPYKQSTKAIKDIKKVHKVIPGFFPRDKAAGV
jgi:hypothetical protein